MATVFKAAPPVVEFYFEGGGVAFAWSKVIEAGGEGGERKQRPPMAPSAFEALLETLTFTNGRVPPASPPSPASTLTVCSRVCVCVCVAAARYDEACHDQA